MERMVLRHLSGSKASQVEEFSLDQFKELIIGRDPSSTIKYDPDKDDLVGREHAKLVQDTTSPTKFVISDLNSRNGTYVNKQRITGTVRITPGDIIQFGPGGPELQFDLDPRPENSVRATRIAAQQSAVPPTHEVQGAPNTPIPVSTGGTHVPVGKATVERMIAQTKNKSNNLIIGLLIIALMVGTLIHYKKPGDGTLKKMSPADIAKANTDAVVFIEASWKLIYTPTGGQVYHRYILNKDKKGKPIVPNGRPLLAAYIPVSGSRVEPYLTPDNRLGYPIGGAHTGSGFTVTGDGFILTNRHVAATWRTAYTNFRADAFPGVIIQGGDVLRNNGRPILVGVNVRPPLDWVPSETKQLGGRFEGRNDYLNVTFAKSKDRIPARLARVSDRHDVAMIKIDVPGTVPRVELNDNYDTIRTGDDAIVLGYPGVSPADFAVIRSEDLFNRETQIRIVPDPTVSPGNIGRILRGQEASGPNKDPLISSFGDAYQLTINSTGAGNSGGPVFDSQGRVIGIFYAGSKADAMITFAVPIRYGKELMVTSR